MSDQRHTSSPESIGGPVRSFDPSALTRPDDQLLRYYIAGSAFSLIFFPIVFIPLWIRFRTLRYRFDDEGVGMSVGLLFKRETYLTYRRIQDIHVTRGLLQRWFGLATVAVQTASGSATPELSIEGILDPDALRDWLYARMRGAHNSKAEPPGPSGRGEPVAANQGDQALELLRDIRDELRSLKRSEARS